MFIDETPDLEQDEIEIQDEETEETEETNTPNWEAEAKKAQSQAKKYKAILDRNKGKDEALKTKSDDFGYDVKGYLKSSGIKASEFDFVKAEIKTFGGDIDALLGNEYFQNKLEKHRELTKTADATPTGKRSGGVATDSVEYWAGKPIEDVPADMRIKVVNARLEKEKNKGVFYNS